MFAVGFYKACKSLVHKKHHHHNKNRRPSKSKCESQDDLKSPSPDEETRDDDDYRVSSSPKGLSRSFSVNNYPGSLYSSLSRTTSSMFSGTGSKSAGRIGHLSRTLSRRKKAATTGTGEGLLSRSTSRREPAGSLSKSTSAKEPARSLSKTMSREGATPLVFSNSTGLVKPPATELIVECTLEELCFGCIKRVSMMKDVVTEEGKIVEELETLSVNVKPGWKGGTKVTFEGRGSQKPGTLPADIIVLIEEKEHSVFKRQGRDLELEIELPLVKALTGGSLPITLLGGEKMRLTLDEIILPGQQKIIQGKGMPNLKEEGQNGNLLITFQVKFPTKLTSEQRAEVFNILQDSC